MPEYNSILYIIAFVSNNESIGEPLQRDFFWFILGLSIRMYPKRKSDSVFSFNNLVFDLVSIGIDFSIVFGLEYLPRSFSSAFVAFFEIFFIFTIVDCQIFISLTAFENFALCILDCTIFSAALGSNKLLKDIHALKFIFEHWELKLKS